MIERYDPFGRMLSLRQMMDRLLEDAFVVPRQGLTQGQDTAESATTGMASLALNAYEEGGNLVVEAHVPGIRPEDIDVSVNQGVLTIRGQAKQEQERRERNYFIREYRAGSFSRSLRLPDNVDSQACEAHYDEGVLRLVFPQAAERQPRRIQIRSGSRQPSMGGAATSSGTGTAQLSSAEQARQQPTGDNAATAQGKRTRASGGSTQEKRA